MKMTPIEKHFVNHPEHTARVAQRAQKLLERIDVQGARRYLDVGCGVGATACEIAEKYGWDVTGVDVDPKQIAAAQVREASPRPRFLVMDATNLKFPDAEFDVVAAAMVTHHLHEWERAVGEMIRVLRPGGWLIYTDMIFPDWFAAVGRRVIPFVGLPSRKRLESLAAAAGLTKMYESGAGLRCDCIWRRGK